MCHDLERHLPGAYRCCATIGRARRSTLDCSTRRRGIDTAGTAGRFGGADSWQHGRADHRAGGARLEVVVLLCRDGDSGIGNRGAGDVSAGAQRRQRNTKEESFSGASGKNHRNFFALGILVDCDRGVAAAAGADGAICDCRGSYAVFDGEIPGGSDLGASDSVQLAGVAGRALWQADHQFHSAPGASVFVCDFRSSRDYRGGCVCGVVGAEKETGARLVSAKYVSQMRKF